LETHGVFAGSSFWDGQGGGSALESGISLSSQHDLDKGWNKVKVKLEGVEDIETSSISCYRTTSIKLIVLNCDSEMNTEGFLYSNDYPHSYYNSRGICLSESSGEHNWREFISGKIQLNSAANSVFNEHDVMLTACKDVILEDGFVTGEGKFIAQAGSIIAPCNTMNKMAISNNAELFSNNETNATLKIHPNPVGEMFNIEIHQPISGQAIIQIYDAQGRYIETFLNEYINAGCYKLEVNNFNHKPGLYFCKYITNNTILTEKIIKTQNHYEF